MTRDSLGVKSVTGFLIDSQSANSLYVVSSSGFGLASDERFFYQGRVEKR